MHRHLLDRFVCHYVLNLAYRPMFFDWLSILVDQVFYLALPGKRASVVKKSQVKFNDNDIAGLQRNISRVLLKICLNPNSLFFVNA